MTPELGTLHLGDQFELAWSVHSNIGDYTTAGLMWLEQPTAADVTSMDALAARYRVTQPALLYAQ